MNRYKQKLLKTAVLLLISLYVNRQMDVSVLFIPSAFSDIVHDAE